LSDSHRIPPSLGHLRRQTRAFQEAARTPDEIAK
jgi:hypothetical protein